MSAGASTVDQSERLIGLCFSNSPDGFIIGGLQQGSTNGHPDLACSSASFLGVAGTFENKAALTAGVGRFCAIPFAPGDTIKTIQTLVGSTEGLTVTEYFVALYEAGKAGGKLLGKSAALAPGTVKPETLLNAELENAVVGNGATAASGWAYAMLCIGAAGTSFSQEAHALTVANQEKLALLNSKAPGASTYPYHGSGGTGLTAATTPTTVPTLTAIAGVPLVTAF